jgi:hypothetical protein
VFSTSGFNTGGEEPTTTNEFYDELPRTTCPTTTRSTTRPTTTMQRSGFYLDIYFSSQHSIIIITIIINDCNND